MESKIEMHDEQGLQSKIYVVRGVQVMLDIDLAAIYGYTVKAFNQQVKNNMEKFDDDFMFQLTAGELDNLRSKFLTAIVSPMSRALPYAFTEQGIYMLMTVLKGDRARQDVAVTIFSDNAHNGLHKVEFEDFCKEYSGLRINVIEAGGIFHDRYIVLDYGTVDEKIYHCGASSKDGGRKVTTITLTEDTAVYAGLIEQLLKNKPLVLK